MVRPRAVRVSVLVKMDWPNSLGIMRGGHSLGGATVGMTVHGSSALRVPVPSAALTVKISLPSTMAVARAWVTWPPTTANVVKTSTVAWVGA